VPGVVLRGLVMDYGGVMTDGPRMEEAVRRAHASGVATALVTAAHAVPDACAALFDLVVLGPALGVRKPDPEIYRRVAARLGLDPGACVVVDDVPANLRGARAAGAVIVHHHDVDATLAELEALLGAHDEGS
jgi:HAD superfamily hydrolase (TIGR01509 family)